MGKVLAIQSGVYLLMTSEYVVFNRETMDVRVVKLSDGQAFAERVWAEEVTENMPPTESYQAGTAY